MIKDLLQGRSIIALLAHITQRVAAAMRTNPKRSPSHRERRKTHRELRAALDKMRRTRAENNM